MNNFAVIRSGSKQYKVKMGDEIDIEKVNLKKGEIFIFEDVLLVANGKNVKIGQPLIKGAKVEAKILEQGRGDKKIVFKYKPKKRYKKKKGHRQQYSRVKIIKITAGE